MIFGIGSGLFFGYIPFLKIGSLPLTTYRSIPGSIMKKASKRLQVKVRFETFRDKQKARLRLDELLREGIPVGCQTGVYWLPYFPEGLRFHFNGHNIVVFGKQGEDYLISDPVLDVPVTCDAAALGQARFALGPMAPKGKLYFIEDLPKDFSIKRAIRDGINATCRQMIGNPFPLTGTRGIQFMGRSIAKWPEKFGTKEASKRLGNVIRMQEEIGTGGGGFRFIFAAFLQEAGTMLHDDELLTFADKMTSIGDEWRSFAALAARACKQRIDQPSDYQLISSRVIACGIMEHEFFSKLRHHMARLPGN